LKPAIAKSPGNAQLWVNLGYALGLKHDVDGASQAFNTALAKKDDPEVHFMYGTMLFEAKVMDKSGVELKKALPGVKQDPATLATIGRMLGGTHAFAECVAAFDRAIKLKGDVAEFWVRRGTCRHELADEPGAQADFEKAIAIDPSFAAAHYYLGLSLVAQKKSLPGARELEKAEKLGKGTPIEKLAHEKLQTAFKPPK
jgi:cytochrome c-type biogenesis protein CcmH/NrfG